MENKNDLTNWIMKVTVSVLAAVIGVVVIVLCVGLFVSNDIVDNTKIFEMINPAFNTIIGAFVGLLGGLSLKTEKKEEKVEEPPAPEVPETPAEPEEHEDHIA